MWLLIIEFQCSYHILVKGIQLQQYSLPRQPLLRSYPQLVVAYPANPFLQKQHSLYINRIYSITVNVVKSYDKNFFKACLYISYNTNKVLRALGLPQLVKDLWYSYLYIHPRIPIRYFISIYFYNLNIEEVQFSAPYNFYKFYLCKLFFTQQCYC